MDSANSHFLRAAGMPNGFDISSKRRRQATTLIIKDTDVEFLKMLTLEEKQANEQSSKAAKYSERPSTLSAHASDESKGVEKELSLRKECPVCLQSLPALTNQNINAVTSCQHVYCYECALRLVFVTNKTDCPICRRNLEKVILTRQTFDSPQDVQRFIKKVPQLQNYQKLVINKIVYYDIADKTIYDHFKTLLYFQCGSCSTDFSTLMGICVKEHSSYQYMSNHLETKHDYYLCDLCFYNLELFPFEYDCYHTKRELNRHKKYGSLVGDTFIKHSECTLCSKTYFFNNEKLAEHCQNTHISCYVCKSLSIFFLDKDSLNEHVLGSHIVCPVCRRADNQVVGFATVNDLKSHAAAEHSGEKIDYEVIIKKAAVGSSPNSKALSGGSSRGGSNVADNEANISLQEAHDQIDNLLRHRHKDAELTQSPSFSQTNTEKYLTLFPSISAAGFPQGTSLKPGQTDVKLFALPSSNFSKQISKGRVINADSNLIGYEQEFPGLCGGGRDTKPPNALKSAASVIASTSVGTSSWSTQANKIGNTVAVLPITKQKVGKQPKGLGTAAIAAALTVPKGPTRNDSSTVLAEDNLPGASSSKQKSTQPQASIKSSIVQSGTNSKPNGNVTSVSNWSQAIKTKPQTNLLASNATAKKPTTGTNRSVSTGLNLNDADFPSLGSSDGGNKHGILQHSLLGKTKSTFNRKQKL